MGTDSTQGAVETVSEFGTDTKGQAKYWKAEITACDKELEKWRQRGQKVVDRYRDEKKDNSIIGESGNRYNILWSNIRTLKPAIYGKSPQPVVERRFKDPDQVARVAALILERTMAFQIATQRGFHNALRGCLEDRLLPGMGSVWVRYDEPETDDKESAEAPGSEAKDEPTVTTSVQSPNAGCMAVLDYVYWRDFGFIPGRSWEEVPAVWRSVFMDRDKLVKRFGADKGNLIPLDYTPARHKNLNDTDEPQNQVFKQARVYEVWDKRSGLVSWVSLGMDDLLDQKPDPIHFPGFFPCPKPLFATNTTGNLVPVPDYCLYQDQADELDVITERLHYLTKALKVVGVYDSENQALARVLNEGVENELIPVDTWAAFAEKGGLKGTLDFVPIERIIEVVTQLYTARSSLIQDIYQITGLSDIVRGSTNPNETAKAQTIKAQFASVRLEDMKTEMATFVTEALQLMAHVAVSLFPDASLIEQSAIMESEDGQQALKEAAAQMQMQQQAAMQQAMAAMQPAQPPPGAPPTGNPQTNPQGAAGVPPTPPVVNPQQNSQPPTMPMQMQMPTDNGQSGGMASVGMPPVPRESVIAQALSLLRQKSASFRVEVAADSMIEPDLNAERQARNEFLTAVTQFLQQAIPATQGMPELAPLMHALLLWGVRGFRVGRDIEGMIEAAMAKIASAGPKPPPPDPKADALKLKGQLDEAKSQRDSALAQQKMQADLAQMQEEMKLARDKLAAEIQAIREKTQAEVEAILIKANVQAEAARNKAATDAQIKTQQVEGDVQARAMEMGQTLQQNEALHQQATTHAQDTHQQGLQQSEQSNAADIAAAKAKAKAVPPSSGGTK